MSEALGVLRPLRLVVSMACVTAALGPGLAAQDSLQSRAVRNCRTANGVTMRLGQGRTAEASPIDTVWRFSVAERQWRWINYRADIGAGWTGGATGAGMTTAPDARTADVWQACAGASVEMREATMMLRNARGVVRLRVDLNELSNLTRAPERDARQPRR